MPASNRFRTAFYSFGLPIVCAFAVLNCVCTIQAQSQVTVPKVFGEHMVLQRDKDILVWGQAEPNATVTVTLDSSSSTAQADANGKWNAKLAPQKAGGPFKMTIGTNPNDPEIVWNDILVGEVWLCSGQSNMQWTVQQSKNPEKEIADANHPMIRHLGVERTQAATPQNDIVTKNAWEVCSPASAGGFTAVGYYFARTLHKELNVPIGIVNSSWGGTRVEPWTPPVGFDDVPALKNISEEVKLWSPGSPARDALILSHIKATRDWIEATESAMASGGDVVASPAFPAAAIVPASHQSPTKLYNAMIHPLVGLPMRGAIWYQGESNHAEGMLYFEKKKALINGWRKIWNQGEFPFYFVQIAPFQYGNEDPTVLPVFWEAQSAVTTLPNTGMVVISDIGNTKDIHPRNKQDVGARLAAFALKNDYGKDVVCGGPVFESMEVADGKLILNFSNVGDGLMARDGKPLTHFEVIETGVEFKPATATIDGSKIILTSKDVKNPVAMRFAWNKLAEPNLINSAGVPASAFRAGTMPSPLSAIPDFDQYQLVYDLDFSTIGDSFSYQVDRHQDVSRFERVAYCVECQKGFDPPEFVFVSMKAFTNDASKIGVPTLASKSRFQQSVGPIEIHSNSKRLKTGTDFVGNIEFWPNNYSQGNAANVKGASPRAYDFGDTPSDIEDGYGSMQIHNTDAKETVFAFNHWRVGEDADLGIGNGPAPNTDWTFSRSLANYSKKRLRVFVK